MASTSTTSYAASSETVTLTKSHGTNAVFFAEEKVALKGKKLKPMISRCDDNNDDDDDDDGVIGAVSAMFKVDDDGIEDTKVDQLLPDYAIIISGEISDYVNQYCKKHDDYSETDTRTIEEEEQLKKWDQEFIQQFDLSTLFDIMLAADHLNISSLLDLSSQSAADLMKDMSVEEVREFFGIINDFTPEEEEALRKENQWAFE